MMPRHDRVGAETLGASGAGTPTALERATRMLAFAQARVAAFARFDLAITDVAWELLLALFVAQERGERASVEMLCDMLDLPRTVSVRWLRALGSGGLVAYDEQAGLAALVRLTPAAENTLRGLIEG